MNAKTVGSALVLAAAVVAGGAGRAAAQTPAVEVGATMVNVVVALDDEEDVTVVGVPSSGFGILNPGVYASIFIGQFVSVEPQLGLSSSAPGVSRPTC